MCEGLISCSTAKQRAEVGTVKPNLTKEKRTQVLILHPYRQPRADFQSALPPRVPMITQLQNPAAALSTEEGNTSTTAAAQPCGLRAICPRFSTNVHLRCRDRRREPLRFGKLASSTRQPDPIIRQQPQQFRENRESHQTDKQTPYRHRCAVCKLPSYKSRKPRLDGNRSHRRSSSSCSHPTVRVRSLPAKCTHETEP